MSTRPPPATTPAAASVEHDALPAGTRFGEFEILRVLGVGGFGIVYLAQDHSLEREVALKEYMPASLAARGAGPQITVRSSSFAETYAIGLRSFVNEARLLARFDHPSLVKVYRFWEDNATAYMVMPFLQGVTLRDTRRAMAHPPDETWIRSVITPILSALELLHREGVYHRDIAPDNILLSHGGPPVLLDFGAARRVISDRTQSLTAILKPSYAPIEQYAEMASLRQGPWTDLYALGAVIHYLLFGVPPAPATARALQEEGDGIESRVVPGVSPRFMEAVAWMLAVRPNRRPQSGEELRAVLEGRAEVPLYRGTGTTVPGQLTTRPPPTPTQPPGVEAASDATRIQTAHLPTFLPTAQAPPPDLQRPTMFGPTAQMPTARVPPPERSSLPTMSAPAPTVPPAAGTAPPPMVPPAIGSVPASTVPPTTFAATRPAGTAGAPLAPPLAPTFAQSAGQPPLHVPPVASAPPLPPRRTQPAPLSPAGQPAAADSVATPARRGQSQLVALLAASFVVVVAIAGIAWKMLGDRNTTTAGAASAPAIAAASTPSIAMPASAPAVVPPPAVATTATPTPNGATPLSTSSLSASSPAPIGPSIARVGQPVPPATALPTESRVGSGLNSGLGGEATRPPLGTGRSPAEERAAAAAASAASSGRVRVAGRPVPRVGEDGTSTSVRPGDNGSFNGSSTTSYPGTDRPRPLGSPAMPSPLPNSRTVGSPGAAPGGQGSALPNTKPALPTVSAEAAPTTARQACGNRVFIALYRCMEERCEEARFRNSAECVETLDRKRQRENR